VSGRAAAAEPCAARTIEEQKLCAEIRKLEADRAQATGWHGMISSVAGLAGVLGAVGAVTGVLLTFRAQRSAQTEQRIRDNQQREDESQRLLDERFGQILKDLGDDSPAVRAGSAISLLGFVDAPHLRDGARSAFNRRVRLATLANLKVTHDAEVCKLLRRVLEVALRTSDALEPVERDFAHAALRRADLSELDLTEADVAFADLQRANLTNSVLFRAQGLEVDITSARLSGPKADLREVRFRKAIGEGADFTEANLRAAHFDEARLKGARFQNARLQSAHFDRAELAGAAFQHADLNDAYFREAIFDDTSLRSITRALNWEKAHFSTDVRERLDSLQQSAPAP
jgi:uncharacterized protein YjbI with pentapeptide repeats